MLCVRCSASTAGLRGVGLMDRAEEGRWVGCVQEHAGMRQPARPVNRLYPLRPSSRNASFHFTSKQSPASAPWWLYSKGFSSCFQPIFSAMSAAAEEGAAATEGERPDTTNCARKAGIGPAQGGKRQPGLGLHGATLQPLILAAW